MSAVRRLAFRISIIALLGTAAAGAGQTFHFSTLTGNAGYGSTDGIGGAAEFNFPQGVAVDSAGNVYVADTDNSTIRKIAPDRTVTTLAGVPGTPGFSDSDSGPATFDHPEGVAVDAQGNVYVADTRNSTIRKVTASGIVSTLAGSAGFTGSTDGTNGIALFRFPSGIAVDSSGTLYVADTYNSTVRTLTPSGTNWVVKTIAGLAGSNDYIDSTNSASRFYQPSGITVGSNLNLYVSDTDNGAIRKISPAGTNWVTTTIALLGYPRHLTINAGILYVADATGDTIRKLTQSGTNWTVTSMAGSANIAGSADGTGNSARFNNPCGIASTTNGTLFVADSLNNTIRKITSAAVVSTFAGTAGGPGYRDGALDQARFNGPAGVITDTDGNVYVADTKNHVIRRIAPLGTVTTLAGSAIALAGSSDGNGTNASFNQPAGLALDIHTNIYVADQANNEIRKLTFNGTTWTVRVIAGRTTAYMGNVTNIVLGVTNIYSVPLSTSRFYTNYSGITTNYSQVPPFTQTLTPYFFNGAYSGVQDGTNFFIARPLDTLFFTNLFTLPTVRFLNGVGTNAIFYRPSSLAFDPAGNLHVADGDTNGVRVIDPDGNVTTQAGSYGMYLIGTNQTFYRSTAVVIDAAGNTYVADAFNNTIRLITSGGSVSTIVGSPGTYGSADGTNASARFASPVGLALDSETNLFVADALADTIRVVTAVGPDWVVTTIGGSAWNEGNQDGDGGNARFNHPSGIAVDSQNHLYITDSDNDTIRFAEGIVDSVPVSVTLQVSQTGSQLSLSWPASALGYQLESTESLAPADWSAVTNPPTPSGADLVVTDDAMGTTKFYRLRKP